jgi:pSer/pThr/pTyr-binding forkhead associated (FHA) protein
MSRPIRPARLILLDAGQPQLDLHDAHSLAEEVFTIGRSPLCHLRIGHPIVSRLHAKVERTGMHYLLSDTSSANGTYVNGHRLEKAHQLLEGDLIGLGSAAPILRFEV